MKLCSGGLLSALFLGCLPWVARGDEDEVELDETKFRQAFDLFDADKDGNLNKEEFGNALQSEYLTRLFKSTIHQLTTVGKDIEQLYGHMDDDNDDKVDVDRMFSYTQLILDPKETSLKNPPKWAPGDPVSVFYAEFLLSAWVLDHAPWNAYHSGLGFINDRSGEYALFDYCPDDTSSTTALIFPKIDVDLNDMWSVAKLLTGQIDVQWRNHAHMALTVGNGFPTHYKNFVRLGNLTGAHFQRYAVFVESQFQGEVFTFDPYEVLVMAEDGKVKELLGSNMCHDFVSNSLWALYRDGIQLKPENMLFRDHIIVYGKTITRVDDMTSFFRKRSMLRFFRTCLLYLEQIKAQFTFGREALTSVWKLGIPAIVYTQQVYYQVELAPPFLNYCYLPLAIPPAKHDPLSTNKLCALSIEANFTNVTLPVPLGLELGVEDQLDQPAVFLALLMIAFGAALPGLFVPAQSSRAPKPS